MTPDHEAAITAIFETLSQNAATIEKILVDRRRSAPPDPTAAAWSYEIATGIWKHGTLDGWEPRIAFARPRPDTKGIRNIKPLYARPNV